MKALLRFTSIELKLVRRDVAALLFPLAIPLFVLVNFGISFEVSDATLPASTVAIALALQALYNIPNYLGSYREQGILRRLSTTPVHPGALLAAQLIVHLFITLLATLLVLAVATLLFGIAPPRNPVGAGLSFLLGLTAMFALGLLIAALAPNGRTASGAGVLLYFPLAFLGGVTVPPEQMPPALAASGAFTPLGAFRQTLQATWAGAPADPVLLGIMAGYAVIVGVAAARLFRWE